MKTNIYNFCERILETKVRIFFITSHIFPQHMSSSPIHLNKSFFTLITGYTKQQQICSLLAAMFAPPPRSSSLVSSPLPPVLPTPATTSRSFVSVGTANFTADGDMAHRRDRVSGHRPRLADGNRARLGCALAWGPRSSDVDGLPNENEGNLRAGTKESTREIADARTTSTNGGRTSPSIF